jgi:hypothetical protein
MRFVVESSGVVRIHLSTFRRRGAVLDGGTAIHEPADCRDRAG